MSYKELIEELIKRMKEVGYDPSSTFVKMLLKEYENLLLDNNTSNILLRSIIARLRGLPDHDRCVWLKTIIGEFDKELSFAKWKEGYEQGKFEGSLEPKKDLPEIPSMVGDWIEYCKENKFTMLGCLDPVDGIGGALGKEFKGNIKECVEWIKRESDLFSEAWTNGYKVKDAKYFVKMKGVPKFRSYLIFGTISKEWKFGYNDNNELLRTYHTRKELEDACFGEVFNSPLFNVSEAIEL